ncbi:MAG: hypothetical protein LBR45_01610 [Bacteroidales bacterium]|jgi:antitoxin component HigA of HigAB toxin-antitoxin module|nr:hypothetical protein [Bacteroidales bacterium]
MKAQFNKEKLTSKAEYDSALSYMKTLITKAAKNGNLDDPGSENNESREICRIGKLCADFEDNEMQFENITVRGRSPLVIALQEEMYKRNMKQKEIAKMIGINDTVFSLFMTGKRHLSLNNARRLYKKMNIDPKLILEYA